jgi:hypothetical protein
MGMFASLMPEGSNFQKILKIHGLWCKTRCLAIARVIFDLIAGGAALVELLALVRK